MVVKWLGGDNLEPGIYTGEYNGKEIMGFQKKHIYVFELKHNGYTYVLHAFSDITYEDEHEEIDLLINYSSAISINQNWDIKESDVNDN